METPAFTENAHKLIPDVSHFADWFATASTKQQQAATGARRLAIATQALDRKPTWAEMVDPETGRLLTLDQLRKETPADRAARLAKVDEHIARNRAAVQKVAAFGTA